MTSTAQLPFSSNFTGQDEHADAVKFANALQPPPTGLYTLQQFCPSVTSQSSCLDVLLFRGILLVAYAAADEVIIARATDLHAIKRLRGPSANVTALAFRQRDAAIVAAFGTEITVFEGWSTAAKERALVYHSSFLETKLDMSDQGAESPIISLSWDNLGTSLCAVADCIVVWQIEPDHLPVRYSVKVNISRDKIPTSSLALGAISPDASLIAVSALYDRTAYVWDLSKHPGAPRSATDIVHGRSGIASIDWKRRGGGNQALMTVDRDGTIRLWVRASISHLSSQRHPHSPTALSWMEEIARSPHAERTPRAGASFLAWGGGGGVADDEGDAMATNAIHPFVADGTAPKPSRCYHWIVRVAGGDARAWRVRGLDDRPRAEFARLEPGCGDPLLGVEEDCEDELPREFPLKDVSITAMKAVAPIPLTTASQYKVGLVKSYAISNGERRLRSPEPPDPPSVVAIFILAVRNGLPFIARYDLCPTANIPAVCRARIGLGHASQVAEVVTSEQNSSSVLGTGGWLASRGKSGDVLLWRTNVSTGAWEPMKVVGILPGSHMAISFAPPKTSSHKRWEIGVLTCDSSKGSLRLFYFTNVVSRHDLSSGEDVQFAKEVAICEGRNHSSMESIVQIVSVSLEKADCDNSLTSTAAVFGVRRNGKLCVWQVSRRRKDVLTIEPSVLRFIGKRHEFVASSACNELTNTRRPTFVSGGADGSLFVYIAGLSEADTEFDSDDFGDSEDEEVEEGVIWLKELCHLQSTAHRGDSVVKVDIMAGASRILAVHASGATVVWCRGTSGNAMWEIEFTIAGEANTKKSDVDVSTLSPKSTTTSSIAYDRDGNFSVVVLRGNGLFERYRRVLGHPWECVQKNENPCDSLPPGRHSIVHIGKGVVVSTNGRGLSVLTSSKTDSNQFSYVSDAAGYSPSTALVAQLLTGGRVWQVSAALRELHAFVRRVTKRKASETSYGAGRGLISPPPSLRMLLSERNEGEQGNGSPVSNDNIQRISSNPFNLGTGKNLFAQLMAKSEANITSMGRDDDLEESSGLQSGEDDLSKLASRLRVVSLAGMTRTEQSVLAAIARACASLKSTLSSLDMSGARFALLAASHRELTRTDPLPLSIVASAVHSSSRDALMDHFLRQPSPSSKFVEGEETPKMWETARALGAGWWISTIPECKTLAERIARADFTANRNADDAALWYIALGRRTALAALYRAQQNTRMAQFLLRDFNLAENRVAAGKNAYVLVSKHRLELAVAFFILSGDVSGALSLIRSRIKDDQLALFLARVIGDDEQINNTLNFIIEKSGDDGDDHCKSMALWLHGDHEKALIAAGKARNKQSKERMGDADRALAGCLPDVVHSLAHVLAIVDRPPVRGTDLAKQVVTQCRKKAVKALLGDGSPVAALVVAFEIIRSNESNEFEVATGGSSKRHIETTLGSALIAAVDTLKGRAICLSGAVRSCAVDDSLQQLILRDIKDLVTSPLGLERTITAVECASFELVKEDEVDSAIAATYAALEVLGQNSVHADRALVDKIQSSQRNCLRMAVSKALLYVQGTLSLLHAPNVSSTRLSELLAKYKLAVAHIESGATIPRRDLYYRLFLEFKGSVLSLRFGYMFLKGDWAGLLQVLRSCDMSHQPNERSSEDIHGEREREDAQSIASCSSLAPEAVSIEALRHVASNPAILRISRSLGHVRRYRKTPLMSIVGTSNGSAAAVQEESFGTPTLAVSADDPFAVIRMHPALSSTLASASAAYLSVHLAASAAAFAKFVAKDALKQQRNSERFWEKEGNGYEQSFRLIKASEALEHFAEDSIAQWVPLQRFGVEASADSMPQAEEAAGAFVDLWSTLGCLPEYAPSLSEAATVAAAEMAAAASRAAIQAAEAKDGGRRRRRRRERQGEFVPNAAKEGLKLFDTTSADSLYGAYPVRFSASAQGPWSGRGRHATLYSEERSLFRTLCVSSTDPPAVVVATPKGIQEIVPSSYTTMPAGFRKHYASKRRLRSPEAEDERLEALAEDEEDEDLEGNQDDDDSFLNTYDGFGEGSYVPLDMSGWQSGGKSMRSKRLTDGHGRKAVWRHQVNATTLASHPLRRRFASGGVDGVVRLWDFADPISLASFREDHFGRISDVCFSGYGNTMMAVYASGHVTIWDDPDVYSSHPRQSGKSKRAGGGSRAKIIGAFDNRAANAATFVDDRHTIAVVGDPTAPPCVGHSLRIFDTREANSSFRASWSAAVNHQFEARCVTVLEDRMRMVTGGLDGSLSIVDMRSKGCIAELPGHGDEVTCVALEAPRGRALVSGSANGEMRLWDSRTLLMLDAVPDAHTPTRHYWSGNGIGGLVGSYGTQGLALTDRSLISCGGDGMVKIWGPGWSDFDLNIL